MDCRTLIVFIILSHLRRGWSELISESESKRYFHSHSPGTGRQVNPINMKIYLQTLRYKDTASEVVDGDFQCLRDAVREESEKQCEDETLQLLADSFSQQEEFTAFRGDPFNNLLLSFRDVNSNLRQNYASFIESVGQNIFPFIVATDVEEDFRGTGGAYKVYFRNGDMRRIVPVGPAYEIYKVLGHLVLGVFAVVSPYFHNPNSINWKPQLHAFQDRIHHVLHLMHSGEALTNSTLNQKLAFTMLEKTDNYINNATAHNSVDIPTYRKYANEMAPLIGQALRGTTKAFTESTVAALQKLKDDMGADEWKNVHVAIPTVWPATSSNIRRQVFERIMSFEQLQNQVFVFEGVRSEKEARTIVGKIVADRALAHLTFAGLENPDSKEHLFSLSTQRDVQAIDTERELDRLCGELSKVPEDSGCPVVGKKLQK